MIYESLINLTCLDDLSVIDLDIRSRSHVKGYRPDMEVSAFSICFFFFFFFNHIPDIIMSMYYFSHVHGLYFNVGF